MTVEISGFGLTQQAAFGEAGDAMVMRLGRMGVGGGMAGLGVAGWAAWRALGQIVGSLGWRGGIASRSSAAPLAERGGQ